MRIFGTSLTCAHEQSSDRSFSFGRVQFDSDNLLRTCVVDLTTVHWPRLVLSEAESRPDEDN